MRRRLTGRQDRGLTLLELVVAIAVLSIGTLAALRATDQSRLALGGAEARLLAQLAAENRAEELRLMGASASGQLPARVRQGNLDITVEVRLAPTAAGLVRAGIRATAPGGEGAFLVTWLPGPGAR